MSPAGPARLSAAGVAVDAPSGLGRDVLLATIGGWRRADRPERHTGGPRVLDAGRPRLAVVARAGAGVDNIDVAAAKACGIHVLNTPGANSVATAEMAFALLLALVRAHRAGARFARRRRVAPGGLRRDGACRQDARPHRLRARGAVFDVAGAGRSIWRSSPPARA
ncbi:MAG: hypothetical protein IPG72_07230 [Ardenticatenales bacterium]|nr:hypothetical protein [Ardenticatenales bacterium]